MAAATPVPAIHSPCVVTDLTHPFANKYPLLIRVNCVLHALVSKGILKQDITNRHDYSYAINSITISDIKGASNIGCLTIYLFAHQTDDPTTCTFCPYFSHK